MSNISKEVKAAPHSFSSSVLCYLDIVSCIYSSCATDLPGKLSTRRKLGSVKRSLQVELNPGLKLAKEGGSSLQITFRPTPYSFAKTTADAARQRCFGTKDKLIDSCKMAYPLFTWAGFWTIMQKCKRKFWGQVSVWVGMRASSRNFVLDCLQHITLNGLIIHYLQLYWKVLSECELLLPGTTKSFYTWEDGLRSDWCGMMLTFFIQIYLELLGDCQGQTRAQNRVS